MKKAHLVKGSAAAKAYMAKLRSKKKAVKKSATSTHKDTKSHNVNIRVVSGVSKAKKMQKDLKSKGLKLTHGYTVAKRKIGEINDNVLRQLKNTSEFIDLCNKNIHHLKQLKPTNIVEKRYNQIELKRWKELLKTKKSEITQLKKHIK